MFTIAGLLAFFIALTIHEFSHGLVAYMLGDSTAKDQNRLSFNPIRHIDPVGTVLLPLLLSLSGSGIMFGWAKPVPVDYRNLRHGKWGVALVSIAGPAANAIGALISLVIFRLYTGFSGRGLENLLVYFLFSLLIVNVMLMLFNLIPIPPLDGSKVLFSFLPRRLEPIAEFLERWGMVLLLLLIFFGGGILNTLFGFVFDALSRLM